MTRVIGQYRVTNVLGEGGMGVVYAAEHTLLGRPAALKLLLPELSSKQEIVQRFFNEARAATAIRHPGIVEIYDFGWTNEGAAYIVMELLQGETLRARRARGPMPWTAALAVTRQIAGALGAAHAKGIVHRDLKPDNIFLVPDPEVPGGERIKLLDFGIAKLAGSAVGQNMTRTGAVIGTPTYMAPEQCRGVAVDSRADLYALGCILFELCSGQPPFVGEGEGDVLAAHIHVPPPSLASRVSGIPAEVDALVRRLLAKSPLERAQTADEVIRIIDAAGTALSGPRAVTAPPVPQPSASKPGAHAAHAAPLAGGTVYSETTLSSAASSRVKTGPRAARRRLLWAGAAAGVVALGGVIALSVGGGGSDTPSTTASIPYSAVESASAAQVAQTPTAAPAAPAPTPAPATAPSPSTAPTASSPPTAPAAPSASPPPAPSSPSPAAPSSPSPAPPSPPSTATTPPPTRTAPAAPAAPAKPAVAKAAPAAPSPPAPAMIDVQLTSSPAGAEVVSNGKVLGKTPFHRALPRQDRDLQLTLRLGGYRPKGVTVHTTADAPFKQSVKLVPNDEPVNPF